MFEHNNVHCDIPFIEKKFNCGYYDCRCEEENEEGYECHKCKSIPTKRELNNGVCRKCFIDIDENNDTI